MAIVRKGVVGWKTFNYPQSRVNSNSQEIIIKKQSNKIVEKFGLRSSDARKKMCAQCCTANDKVIIKIWFQGHTKPLRIWEYGETQKVQKHQIDYLVVYKRFRNALRHFKTGMDQLIFWRVTCVFWRVSGVKIDLNNELFSIDN